MTFDTTQMRTMATWLTLINREMGQSEAGPDGNVVFEILIERDRFAKTIFQKFLDSTWVRNGSLMGIEQSNLELQEDTDSNLRVFNAYTVTQLRGLRLSVT